MVKKWIIMIMSALLVLSYPVTILATDIEDSIEIDVKAKAVYNIKGEYSVSPENDKASVKVNDNITVSVSGIPKNTVRLVVVPIPDSEKTAWSWITECLANTGTPIHAFYIYFEDEKGNRSNAKDALISIECSQCAEGQIVSSLTTDGAVNMLSASVRGNSLTFTSDGSHYYIIAENSNISTSVGGDSKSDTKSDSPTDTKSPSADKRSPQTGDNSNVIYAIMLLVLSGAVIIIKKLYICLRTSM